MMNLAHQLSTENASKLIIFVINYHLPSKKYKNQDLRTQKLKQMEITNINGKNLTFNILY
jgi:hypothetical protein